MESIAVSYDRISLESGRRDMGWYLGMSTAQARRTHDLQKRIGVAEKIFEEPRMPLKLIDGISGVSEVSY